MRKCIILLVTCLFVLSSATIAQIKSTAAFKDLVGTDWKGVVWEPYKKDWTSAGTVSDGREIADCGIKWVRPWVKADDPFEKTDAMIGQCKAAGLNIVLCYNKSYPYKALGSEDEQEKEVARLKAFVQRYKKDVHYWEIHNEPNLDIYWSRPGGGQGAADPAATYNLGVRHFVAWLKLAYTAIKAEDPDAVVILGGISNWKLEEFMDRFTIEGGYQYLDEVAFHPYAVNDRAYPDESISRLKSFQEKMNKWPAPKNDLPIWITEVGFHTGPISSPGKVADETIKARYLEETMRKLIHTLHYARPVFWYIFHEMNASQTCFSLVKKYEQDGVLKTEFLPAYYTYKNMTGSWKDY